MHTTAQFHHIVDKEKEERVLLGETLRNDTALGMFCGNLAIFTNRHGTTKRELFIIANPEVSALHSAWRTRIYGAPAPQTTIKRRKTN